MDAPRTLQQASFTSPNIRTAITPSVPSAGPDGVVKCPRCGSDNVTYLASANVWKCDAYHPRAKFSLKVGTVFEDSPLPLQKWLPALWLITNCKNGISSYELGRALGVTQESARFMLHRLRLALRDSQTGGKLGGHVEADETYIGGKTRNKSIKKRKQLGVTMGRSMGGKVAVTGLLERHADGYSRVRTGFSVAVRRATFSPSSASTSTPARTSTPTPISRIRGCRASTFTTLWTTAKSTWTGRSTPPAAETTGAS